MLFQRRRASTPLVPILLGLVLALGACNTATGSTAPGGSRVINVVAAENFYGDMVRQLGGSHVSVTSILSDPNADPHQYEANVQTGIAVSKADLVIENGGGYDAWMEKILAGSPNSSRLLLKGYDTASVHLPDNEHVWYSIENAGVIARAISANLTKLDQADAHEFAQNLQAFEQSLLPLSQKIATIKAKYNGAPVGLTETIYLYQSQVEGLNVLTPFAFEKAIAEGNDPPADTIITVTNQINNQQIRVLIYNEQTVTPVTSNLKNLAQARHIPLVPVTETMPPGKTYQNWMLDQLNARQTALGG